MKPIQSPIFWVILLLVIVPGIAVARRLSQRAEPTAPTASGAANGPAKEPGFREIVKDPQLWREMMDAQEDIDREAETAKAWSDEKVAGVVRWFVFDVKSSRDASGVPRVLRGLGPRTHPELLRILRDPALRARLVQPTGEDVLPETPFNRMYELLDDPPAEAAALLAPFIDDPSSGIRKDAALLLGKIGTAETMGAIRTALADSDEYVRSYALMGLYTAAKADRLSEHSRRELFVIVQRLVSEGKNRDNATELLLKLDRPRATEFFLSDAALDPQCRALYEILRLLNQEQIPVPRVRVVTLIEKLDKPGLEYPHTYQLGEALRTLGRHRITEDRERLNGYLPHADKQVAEGAAEGLLASHGLGAFRERIREVAKARGWDALTVPQQHYCAVSALDGEVNNGGFSQYFFNSAGEDWRVALAGLEAMGSKERMAVFREALAKFGPAGPSEKRDERMTQLAKVAKANDQPFDDLDSRYYKSSEVIDVMVMRYVLKNPEAFR